MGRLTPFRSAASRSPERSRLSVARAAIALLVLAAVVGACAHSQRRQMRVPGAETLYVVAFVDQTDKGSIGVPLAEAIQTEVYRRAPERLSVVFDDNSVALDGTVVSLEDFETSDGEREVRMRLRMQLVAKTGRIETSLPDVQTRAPYVQTSGFTETEKNRFEAIDAMIRTAAREIVDEIDRRGAREGSL